MLLTKVPTFSRVRVTDWGSIDGIEGIPHTIDDVMTVWTRCHRDENPFVTVEIRGLLGPDEELVWLPEDAQVEVVEPVRYAGMPEDLIKEAKPVKPPKGSLGTFKTPEGWPELIWDSDIVCHAVQGMTDPQIEVETLMCGLAVAPTRDPDVRLMMLAALKARYAMVSKDPLTYPPERYPWRKGTAPDEGKLEYLAG